jgi:hypothetical protein
MLVLVCLEIVQILMRDWCTVCVEHTMGSKIILDAPDGSPMSHWSCGILFQSIWRQWYCQCKIDALFAPNIAQKSFWMHPTVLLGDEAQVDASFGLFGDSANLDAR